MIKYYKFQMLTLFKDELEDKEAYYPMGIVSLVNYEQLMFQNKISVMWKSPEGIAYESLMDIDDVTLEECSPKEYKELSDDIDYSENNNIQKLLNETLFDTPLKAKPTFKVIKNESEPE